MILILPNPRERLTVSLLQSRGFYVSTRRLGRRNVNVAREVPTLTNVVQLTRKPK